MKTQENQMTPVSTVEGVDVRFGNGDAAMAQLTRAYEQFRAMHEAKEERQRIAAQRLEDECRRRARRR